LFLKTQGLNQKGKRNLSLFENAEFQKISKKTILKLNYFCTFAHLKEVV